GLSRRPERCRASPRPTGHHRPRRGRRRHALKWWAMCLPRFSRSFRFAIAGVALVAALAVNALPASAQVTSVSRVSGSDRIDTSLAVSEADYPDAGSAGAVVLATSDTFPD